MVAPPQRPATAGTLVGFWVARRFLKNSPERTERVKRGRREKRENERKEMR